jgi:SAM-dependent methyltransferase
MHVADIRLMSEMEARHWWFAERRSILARELRGLGPPGRALDIGAGGGGNTGVLIKHGWDTQATDYSEASVGILRERGIKAVAADARDLPWEDGTFGVVTAFDVIEHIEEDHRAMAEIFRVLRPGGSVIITVPCDMRLWSAADVAYGHVRRYDRDTITAVVSGAGFVIDQLWSWNVLLRPVVAWSRRRVTGSDLYQPPWPVNACLRAIVVAERYLPLRSRRGVTLVLTAHKPAAAGPGNSGLDETGKQYGTGQPEPTRINLAPAGSAGS